MHLKEVKVSVTGLVTSCSVGFPKIDFGAPSPNST